MKTIKMEKDQFAKFTAKQILNIKSYSFDMFYDIAKIINQSSEHCAKHETPIFDNYHLMIRETGCDMIKPENENYKIYANRSTKVYNLTFCWNRDYFHNIPFCKVTKIK